MPRAVELLGGGILGAIAGSFLCVPLIAHVFGPATVTWDTSACPPGIYTITSTATSADGSRTFTTTTQHIRLPNGSLVQEFTDLPFGQFLVSAIARDARGRTFPSGTQTVIGQGPSRGHQSARALPVGPQGSYAAPARSATLTPPPPSTKEAPATNRSATNTPTADLPAMTAAEVPKRMAAAGLDDLLAACPWWKSITFVDSDDDGVIDEIRIEWTTGEVLLTSVGR